MKRTRRSATLKEKTPDFEKLDRAKENVSKPVVNFQVLDDKSLFLEPQHPSFPGSAWERTSGGSASSEVPRRMVI
jgi:hypothetical protein